MVKKTPSLWEKLLALYKQHKELVDYLFIGGLTTVLNYVVYAICLLVLKGNDHDYSIATAVSNIVAVIFAYYANKHIVFHTKTANKRDAIREAGSFFLMRAISFVLALGLMELFVKGLSVNKWIAMIPVQVVIVLANYVFSKLFIFKK